VTKNTPQKDVQTLWKNFITISGVVLAVVAGLFWFSLEFFSFIAPTTNPYIGIATFLILPALIIMGLLMIPVGVFITRWYYLWRKIDVSDSLRYPRIDLSLPSHRRTLIWIAGLTVMIIPFIGVLGSMSYKYSESKNFCGLTCHDVMRPQFARYQLSSHARIDCTQCHVGPGFQSAVKAKLNGTKQLIEIILDSYPRPVPPAITEMRPARETCEECHWPSRFFGQRMFSKYSYRSDENNSRRETDMLLQVGGGDPETGLTSGIHWHMVLAFQVDYVATDESLQEIPWTKFTNLETGQSRVYRTDGLTAADPPPEGVARTLDCLDCHNRSAHRITAPSDLVDIALEVGSVSSALPFVKREAVNLLVQEYPDREVAEEAIQRGLSSYYQENYPDLFDQEKAVLDASIKKVVDIYNSSFFPEMNANWRTYPDNIGHKIFPGCFRCHDDRHVADNGEELTTDCKVCHTLLTPSADGATIEVGKFNHPLKLQEALHGKVACYSCHTGGQEQLKTCDGACHVLQKNFITAEQLDFTRFEIGESPMLDLVECDDCHDESQPKSFDGMNSACLDCHEGDDEDYSGTLRQWLEDLEQKQVKVKAALDNLAEALDSGADTKQWLAQTEKIVQSLSKAGPAHNYDAAIKIYTALTKEAKERTAIAKGEEYSEEEEEFDAMLAEMEAEES